MALSREDREWVKLIAEKLAFEALKATLGDHIKACPYGKRITLFRGMVMGAIFLLVAMGAGPLRNWLMALATGGL